MTSHQGRGIQAYLGVLVLLWWRRQLSEYVWFVELRSVVDRKFGYLVAEGGNELGDIFEDGHDLGHERVDALVVSLYGSVMGFVLVQNAVWNEPACQNKKSVLTEMEGQNQLRLPIPE